VADPPRRLLVACVGNILRGDDGFGIAVAARLQGVLPPGTDVIETGIGSLAIVHQLMEGYGGVIIVDAVDANAPPGALLVLAPEVPEITEPTFEDWQAQLADLHLAEPSRILRLVRAVGALPQHVLLVGCRPETCEDYREGLSAAVAAAVPVAAERVRVLAEEFMRNGALDARAGRR
jgi:hydrogenase maturation protease